jgi:uncharacterized cysteine cluster protein YcgN (CxxCxxCC family)
MSDAPFWKNKPLNAMSPEEWESLCDGCGRCCLNKLRQEDTDELMFTNVGCRLLDLHSCRCTHYDTRRNYVPECISLTPKKLRKIDWLPPSCAYRCVAENRDLPPWHHLVCGDRDAVHHVGASVRGRVISETDAGPLEDHIVDWPGRNPRRKPRIKR